MTTLPAFFDCTTWACTTHAILSVVNVTLLSYLVWKITR